MHPIHFFGPNSDILVRLGQFCYCTENHAGVAFNAPIRVGNETMHRIGYKRNERTQFTFLDPRVMFWFVWVSFVTATKTMPGLYLMHRFGSETKRCTESARNEMNAPNSFFGPNSDVLVRLGQFRYCTENHAGVAFNAPIRVGNETMHGIGYKRNERTQFTFLDPRVMFWFVWVSFVTAPKTMPGLHLMHRFGSETKRCTESARNETNSPNSLFWTQ